MRNTEELYTISKVMVLTQWVRKKKPQLERGAKEATFRLQLEKGDEGTLGEELRIKGMW